MKRIKISSLTFCALAGSALLASAAATKVPDHGTNYIMNAQFTNHPPLLLDVSGVPVSTNLQFTGFTGNNSFGVVYTDGAGKIDGVRDLVVTNLSGDVSPFATAKYVVDVAGSLNTSGKSNTANVKMILKGDGYAEDAAGATQGAS